MSEFHVSVIRLGKIEKHPNADTLSVVRVNGDYPVIFRTGDFKEGDLAVYVPVDSEVPDTEQWAFLKGHRRIKAKKLRGIFSMGVLAPLPITVIRDSIKVEEGMDAQELMGITKWEPKLPLHWRGENERDPGFMPLYTDLEGLRRYPDVLQEGEEVVLTEKVHGANGRFCWHEDRLWVGSHRCIKKETEQNLWWTAARKENLAEKLQLIPDLVMYGEVYGQVQDLLYSHNKGEVSICFFDAYRIDKGSYLDYDEFMAVCLKAGLKAVPEIYRGPWRSDLKSESNGPTIIGGYRHMREGFVAKPVKERWNEHIGRVILKLVGEDYLLRNQKE